MDKHDQLAKRMTESSGLSIGQSSIELSPLEQLIARVQVRWPFPEMGDLEYLDWKESLKSCPLEKIQAALDHIMRNPPKSDQGEYRGRPTLVDVLRTMDILADEQYAKNREKERREREAEWKRLEQRRKEHPEEFFGLADVLRAANITDADASKLAKPMPTVKTIWPDIDPGKNAEKLRQQAETLLKSQTKGDIPSSK